MEIAKVIGGEKEVERDNLYHYTTDSGRSSIRLILQSGLESKKFLVPNFLCEVILDVLEEFKVDYTLYNVEKDLTTNLSDYDLDEFEVLFVIDYFGKENEILSNLWKSVV